MSSPVDKTPLQKIDSAKRIGSAPLERRDTIPAASSAHNTGSSSVEEISPASERRNRAIQRSEQYTALNQSIEAFHLSGASVSTAEKRAVFAVLENSVHSRLHDIRANQLTDEAAEALSLKLAQDVKGLSTNGIGEVHILDSHQVYSLVKE